MPSSSQQPDGLRTRLILVFALTLALQGLEPPGRAFAATCGGEATVEKAGAALIKAATTGTVGDFSRVLGSYSNMKSIALFALGKHQNSQPPGRLQEFVGLTSGFIARTFNDYRLKFKAESLTVLDCRAGVIHTKLDALGNSRTHPVLWRLTGGKIVDMNIQNIWLSQLLRTKFNEVLSKSNGQIDALFDQLKG